MDYVQTLAQLAAEIAELRQAKCDLESRLHSALHDTDASQSRQQYLCEVIARLSDNPEIPAPEDVSPYKGLYARPNNGEPRQVIGGVTHMLPAYTHETSNEHAH